MQIDRILYPIESLGPGKRLVIWTVGCSKHCPNCSNRELWERTPNKEIPVEELVSQIKKSLEGHEIDGITITGGDPMEQPDDLLLLLNGLVSLSSDVLIYTGYTFNELKENVDAKMLKSILSKIAVLIDGRYIDDLNDNTATLRGSSNQQVFYFDSKIKQKYKDYMDKGRKVQNVFCGDKVISVGIHNKEE